MPKAKQTDFITLRGRTQYAKILGKPMGNYDGDGKEWKLDLVIDDNRDLARLKKLGLGDRIKSKDDYLDGAPHITVRQRELNKDGEPNDPPRVVDVTGADWNQKTLIGNETIVDLKLRVVDYGKGFKKGVYISGIRVLELVPYTRPLFDELDEDDPYFQKANKAQQEAEDEAEPADDEDAAVETNADDEDEAPRRRTPPARKASSRVRETRADDDELDDDVPF